MPDRIDKLTKAQEAQMASWADKWIEIGLRTGPADRERFEASVRRCYECAGIPWPGVVVWAPSPLVLSLAAPTASLLLRRDGAVGNAVGGTVGDTADDTVGGAVCGAVRSAVRSAVRNAAVGDTVRGAVGYAVDGAVGSPIEGAVRSAVGYAVGGVRDAMEGAVGNAVRGAVGYAVDDPVGDTASDAVGGVRDAVGGDVRDTVSIAVGSAVGGAVSGAVGNAVGNAVEGRDAVRDAWDIYIGGQLWVGGWWYGGAWTSYFREVCDLQLPGDLWDRARAYEGTMESACWWWPHRQFVMVSERPTNISRELVDPARPRGWNSHRLHCDTGPAIAWPDGWGVWLLHGTRVPQRVVETPAADIPVQWWADEENVEVRHEIEKKIGAERLLHDLSASTVHAEMVTIAGTDHPYEVQEVSLPNGDRRRLLAMTNPSTGESHREWVPLEINTCREALAWRNGTDEMPEVIA